MTKLLPFKQFLSCFWLPFFQANSALEAIGWDDRPELQIWTPTQWRQKTVSTSTELLMTHGGGVGWREGSSQALSAYKQHIQKQRVVTNVMDPRQVMRIHLHSLTFVILARSLGLGNWVPNKPLVGMILVLVSIWVWLFCFTLKLLSPLRELHCISKALFRWASSRCCSPGMRYMCSCYICKNKCRLVLCTMNKLSRCHAVYKGT